MGDPILLSVNGAAPQAGDLFDVSAELSSPAKDAADVKNRLRACWAFSSPPCFEIPRGPWI